MKYFPFQSYYITNEKGPIKLTLGSPRDLCIISYFRCSEQLEFINSIRCPFGIHKMELKLFDMYCSCWLMHFGVENSQPTYLESNILRRTGCIHIQEATQLGVLGYLYAATWLMFCVFRGGSYALQLISLGSFTNTNRERRNNSILWQNVPHFSEVINTELSSALYF